MKSVWSLILLFWVAVALTAPLLGLHPDSIHLERILSAPDMYAWLGGDDLGRDILARLLAGAQVSIAVAAIVTVATMLLGTMPLRLCSHFEFTIERSSLELLPE